MISVIAGTSLYYVQNMWYFKKEKRKKERKKFFIENEEFNQSVLEKELFTSIKRYLCLTIGLLGHPEGQVEIGPHSRPAIPHRSSPGHLLWIFRTSFYKNTYGNYPLNRADLKKMPKIFNSYVDFISKQLTYSKLHNILQSMSPMTPKHQKYITRRQHTASKHKFVHL